MSESKTHELDIRLVFEHRGGQKNEAFGTIGSVDFSCQVVNPVLNGSNLGTRSIRYLVAYGIRKAIADVFASAESAIDAKDKFK